MSVTDAALQLCLERGIATVHVGQDAVGITDDGILAYCFGASANFDDLDVRELTVEGASISDRFAERRIEVCDHSLHRTDAVSHRPYTHHVVNPHS